MNDRPYPKGTKLWDIYFKLVVVVEKSRLRNDARYPKGRYYTVRYASGTVNEGHEKSFELFTWQRPRDGKGHFVKLKIE